MHALVEPAMAPPLNISFLSTMTAAVKLASAPSTAVALRMLWQVEEMPQPRMRDFFFRCEPASSLCVVYYFDLCTMAMSLLTLPRDKLVGKSGRWLVLAVLVFGLPTTTALQDVRAGTTHEEAGDFGREAGFTNASPLVNSSINVGQRRSATSTVCE